MPAQLDIDDVVADHPLAKAELERLREALRAITRRVPIMGSTGDYRDGQLHALEACATVAREALS